MASDNLYDIGTFIDLRKRRVIVDEPKHRWYEIGTKIYFIAIASA